jgi:hypothetical protein
MIATTAGQERAVRATEASVLDDGVVLVLTRGATEDALALLLARPGIVVAYEGPGVVVARCAELAQVTRLDCPLARTDAVESQLHDLFAWAPFARDLQDAPLGPWLVREPSPGDNPGTVHSIFVPTDGTPAAIERVRTQAILAAPYGLARTSDDSTAARLASSTTGAATIFQVAMLFVMIVAACSLTVSMVATMIERRRPFALLRAAGMPLGQLRRMTVFETTIPLVVTAVAGVVIAFVLISLPVVLIPGAPPLSLPSWSFLASVGLGLLAAATVSLVSWPLMDSVTRHDGIRYE